MKRAANMAARAGGTIERFIERTLAPRIEELAGEIRGMRGELGQFDKRLTENIASLRNEMVIRIDSLRSELIARIDNSHTELASRIDSLPASWLRASIQPTLASTVRTPSSIQASAARAPS